MMAKAPAIQPINRSPALGQWRNKTRASWPQCTGQPPFLSIHHVPYATSCFAALPDMPAWRRFSCGQRAWPAKQGVIR